MYSDQSTTSTEIRNWISPQTALHSATNFYYTMSTQTLDGKPPSRHTAQYKLTCGCLRHPVNTDSGRKATIRTYMIQEDLWPLAIISAQLWTENTILTYKIQEDSTACSNINTDNGRKWPSWQTKYKRTCDRLPQYKLPNFAWNYPTKVGATTWTLNTKG